MTKECMGEEELDGGRGVRTVYRSCKENVYISGAALWPNIDMDMGRVRVYIDNLYLQLDRGLY